MHHPFLTSRSNSQNLYFRRSVPDDLRATLNRREIWISLRTSDRALAVTRLPNAAQRYEQQINAARAALGQATADEWFPPGYVQATGPGDVCPAGCTPLTERQIPALMQRYRAHALHIDDELRSGMNDAELDDHEAFLSTALKQVRRAVAARNFSSITETAEHLLDAERLWLAPSSTSYEVLLESLLATERAVLEEELQRVQGEGAPTPELAPLVDAKDTWAAAMTLWVAESAPAAKTVSEVRSEVARFIKLVGNKPLSELSDDDVDAFKDALLGAGLSHSRINTVLSLLSPLLSLAIRKRYIAQTQNPFSRKKYPKKTVKKNTKVFRDAYTMDELNRVFRSPVYTRGERPAKGGGDAAYWLPLLALTTGARAEDCARIAVSDLQQRDGVYVLRLHDTKREERLGIPNITRLVPVHTRLIEAGLLSYVEQRRQAGATALLFPALHVNQYGKRSAVFSNWYGAYLDDVVGLNDPRLVFHSLRHTFKTFAEESGVNDRVIEELIGHDADDNYGRHEQGDKRLPFKLLVDAMNVLKFPGLVVPAFPLDE